MKDQQHAKIKPTKAILKYHAVLKKEHSKYIKMGLELGENKRYAPIKKADKAVALGLDIAIEELEKIFNLPTKLKN